MQRGHDGEWKFWFPQGKNEWAHLGDWYLWVCEPLIEFKGMRFVKDNILALRTTYEHRNFAPSGDLTLVCQNTAGPLDTPSALSAHMAAKKL